MACPGSFLSSCGEKHPDPKSCREIDPDKLHVFSGISSPTPEFSN